MDASTRTQFKQNLKYCANFDKNNPNYKAKCSEIARITLEIDEEEFETLVNSIQNLEICSKYIIDIFDDLTFENENYIKVVRNFNADVKNFNERRFNSITQNTSLITIVYVLFHMSEKLKGIQRIAKTENENPKLSKII